MTDEDEQQRKHWWDGLSGAERSRWLDCAWRQNEKAAGRTSYSLEDMPTEADAWAAFRAAVAEGDASLDRGEGVAYTPELLDSITREATELAHSGKPIDPDVCP
jgi:hypothetical protein